MQQQSQLKDYFFSLPPNVPLRTFTNTPSPGTADNESCAPCQETSRKVPAPQSLPTTHADTDADTDTDTEPRKGYTGYLSHQKETGSGELC